MEEGGIPQEIAFHYIKSSDYRTVHADGIIGGITPHLGVHMAVYAEHAAIPQKSVHKVRPDGAVLDEVTDQRVSRGGIVRDLALDLVMNEAVATEMHRWLGERLEELGKIKKERGL